MMNDVLGEELDKMCVAYLNFIVVYIKTKEKHANALEKVLSTLEDNALYANAKKCKIAVKQLDFLGY